MTLRNYSSTAAEATLAAGVSAANTTLLVSGTTGFPAVPFVLALGAGSASQELVLVTNVAGTTLTVTRGYDSTVASIQEAGTVVQHSHAALDFREANAHVNANSGVHGATGSVVGTTDAQTLTNKTLALGSNTLSGTRAQFNTAMTDDDFATLAGTETLTNKTLTAPVINGALTGTAFAAWTAWTPTVTAETGTFTTVAGSGRYTQVGKKVDWSVTITITTVGTAANGIRFTLPVTAQATGAYVGNGRNTATGAQVQIFLFSTSVANVVRYDNASAIGVGTIVLSGTYEAA